MPTKSNYTQGYSAATVASHAARTIHSDAAFLLPHIKPTDRILDVGCGPGTITAGLAGLVPQGSVFAIDISDEVLALARSHLAGLDPPPANVTLQQADLLAGLAFPDGAFDVVFASQLFPHLPSARMRRAALAEMRRVLRPGGVLATRDAAELHFYPRARNPDALLTRYGDRARAHGGDGDESMLPFPGGDMPALYAEVGFDAAGDRVKPSAGMTVYAGREQREWIAATSLAKLAPGDPYRDSWTAAGITDEEIEKVREAFKAWGEDPGAWYVAVQAEVLGWK
ncbi:uncharacterized protein E0L32_009934 [Thyridium curvatum]|uniref:Methyltransferase domain-containing protein n=1 Tax=Thyridium curvatum TaxID=1093900 RepID=A0A507AG02_9PEZI|nr:uncharacterized protein E0L32_009934 [Thyridium curvatum]TPX08595.1 hypothetical protein E0L32_009934 [Thyridium curvatum]